MTRPRILCAADAASMLAKVSPNALAHASGVLRAETISMRAGQFPIWDQVGAIADALEVANGAHGYELKQVASPDVVSQCETTIRAEFSENPGASMSPSWFVSYRGLKESDVLRVFAAMLDNGEIENACGLYRKSGVDK